MRKKTTIAHRTSLLLTLETHRQLEEMCEIFGENKTQVIVRALSNLHYNMYCKFENSKRKVFDI